MKLAIKKHIWDFVAILVVAVIGVIVGSYILSNQRFYLPAWVPIVGSDFVNYEAEFSTAQAVTPGQGQTVQVAGVSIGEIGTVTLRDGKAVVQMKLKKKYTPIYRDATALMRPKTALNDMTIELDPGNTSAGELPEGGALPDSQTQPAVNPDEFFAGLDSDTRDYLQLLVGGAGEGLDGNAEELSATLKRFDPTARYLKKINAELEQRDDSIRRSIHNFRQLSEALGDTDTQIGRFVDSSNRVFRSFANEQDNLRKTLRLLPTALSKTSDALEKSGRLAKQLGPTLGELRPTARGLAPALQGYQQLANDTTPVFRDQLRPFVDTAAPAVEALRPAASDLSKTLPGLTDSLDVLNTLFNTIAYNPPGKDEGFLYWLGWANHLGASVFNAQDAHGPVRRGLIYGSCASLQVFSVIGKANPLLGTLSEMLNAPKFDEVCKASDSSAASAAAKAAIAKATRKVKAEAVR